MAILAAAFQKRLAIGAFTVPVIELALPAVPVDTVALDIADMGAKGLPATYAPCPRDMHFHRHPSHVPRRKAARCSRSRRKGAISASDMPPPKSGRSGTRIQPGRELSYGRGSAPDIPGAKIAQAAQSGCKIILPAHGPALPAYDRKTRMNLAA
jgi:hypothetical protein